MVFVVSSKSSSEMPGRTSPGYRYAQYGNNQLSIVWTEIANSGRAACASCNSRPSRAVITSIAPATKSSYGLSTPWSVKAPLA